MSNSKSRDAESNATHPERQGGGGHLPGVSPRPSDDPDRLAEGIPPGKKKHDGWGDDRSAFSPQSDPDVNDGNARPTRGE